MSEESLRENVIIGIDILPGESVASIKEPHYAVAVLKDDKIIEKKKNVSLRELKNLIRRIRPCILAVDNIFEIVRDKDELVKFLSEFDFPLKIIQVTKVRGEDKSLEEVARELEFSQRGKLSPMDAAELIAQLANLKIGSFVEVFEEETKITVSRKRSLGSGGMSTERYKRNIQSLILRVTKEIKETLDKAGFDYDLFFRKGDHGLQGSTFIVYAPREKLYGVVRPMKGHDVQVVIKPTVKSEIEFVPTIAPSKRARSEVPQRYLMVGIDPGIVTGVAVISLSGRPIVIFSKRELSRNQLIRVLSSYGRVVLVATDVVPPPLYVKKLATSLNAVLYTPSHTLSVEEKRKLVQNYRERYAGMKVLNAHQRDALAAVLKAYNSFKPKFEKLEKGLRRIDVPLSLNEAKALLIRGKTIKEVIEELSKRAKPKERVCEIRTRADEISKYIEGLRSRIASLEIMLREKERENRELQHKVSELEKELLAIQRKLIRIVREREAKVLRDRKVMILSETIESLRKRLASLEAENSELREKLRTWKLITRKALKGEIEELINIPSLTPSRISSVGELKDKIIYVASASSSDFRVAETLSRLNVKAVVIREPLPLHIKEAIEEAGIPVVEGKDIDVTVLDGCVFANKPMLEEIINRELRRIDIEREKRFEMTFERIIEEYRIGRIKELRRKLKQADSSL